MGTAYIQAAIDINITYDEDQGPDKEELRVKLEEAITHWCDNRDGMVKREIEVYVRGGKK